MRCFARLIRWAMVASGTRKARAISAVVRPPTARSVRASWAGSASAGWPHSSSRASVSSASGGDSSAADGSGTTGSSAATATSRRRRAFSLRHWSVSRREATVSSQARGLSGVPCSRPVHGRLQQRLLDHVLAGLELPVPAHQDGQHLGRQLAQQVRDGGGHISSPPGPSTGRTSTPW